MNNPLAVSPNLSKGRLFEENHEITTKRTPFERDRDRIIHSSSFRKLKHKTQVFIESDSDYYRTRLTHSLEVAQISRSLCRAMHLNEDLGEVVALAHDLGHPPFGHNGEKSLNECMNDFGGFNHNDQTLRVITKIEKRHPNFDGLNLTWESLEGIVKHNGTIIKDIPFHIKNYNNSFDLELNLNPHLESQIAAIAKLIDIKSLKEIDYFNNLIKKVNKKFPNIDENLLTYQMLRLSISEMINDIISNSLINIDKNQINTINDVKKHEGFLINMSDKMKNECSDIRSFLFDNVYNHKRLLQKRQDSEKIIFKLFKFFEKNFNQLPEDWLLKIKFEDKNRIICDYISGMTDRYASKLYKKIYE